MEITNKTGLSKALYDAIVKVDKKYSKGDADFSTTELIGSPRIRILMQRHKEEITEDASDLLWRFMGHVVHEVLANMDNTHVLVEERFFVTVDGKVISGCPDLYDGSKITDYKFTSKYAVKDGVKPEWEPQLNIYNYILERNGFNSRELEIEAILRDAVRDEPKTKTMKVLRWDTVITLAYIKGRIKLHLEAEKELPLCTEEERWHVPDKWALMKKNRKTAIKLYDNEKKALDSITDDGKTYVEHRPGADKRCGCPPKGYCAVSDFCEQFKKANRNR